ADGGLQPPQKPPSVYQVQKGAYVPRDPFSPPDMRIPTMRNLPGQIQGKVMRKRHPRSQANVVPLELMAALALTDVGSAWKRQRSTFYRSKEFRQARIATMQRAGGACQRCQRNCPQSGHCHHMAPLRTNWAARLDPANLQWLCPNCHR